MLETRTTSRSCRIIEEALRRIALGVQQNHAFTPQALLIFIHSVISNSIPQLTSKPKSVCVGGTQSVSVWEGGHSQSVRVWGAFSGRGALSVSQGVWGT